MDGPVLMECYEDVFEEIASKFYSDEPLNKTVVSPEPFMRFASRLTATQQSQYTLLAQQLNNDQGHNNNNNEESGVEDTWIESAESLSWSPSKVARYNPTTKMYKCVDCDTVGFLSRIAEHWLGAHANLKVFRCPRCPYSSAWARCVRMHLTRHHNEQHSDAALWKDNAALDDVTKLLQNLRHTADSRSNGTCDGESPSQGFDGASDKRYACPQCPYATDRRDLYTRHENIHKDEKPFHCYICYKMFSRADHVKKHFFRMHKDRPYDIHLIRRLPVKNNSNSTNNNFIQRNNNKTSVNISANDDGNNTLNAYNYNNNINSNGISVPAFSSMALNRSGDGGIVRNGGRARNSDSGQFGLSSSKKRHLPKMFSCTYCSWRGVDNWCLKRHLNTHIKPYLCVLCDYKAARAERLSTHVLKIHNKRICNKCSFLAEDQVQLNRHAREAHHDRNLVKCEDCSETFDGPSELESHAIMAHNRDLLDCDHCDFKTTYKKSLESHKEERHAEDSTKRNNGSCKKEICCRECGCEFANQSSLQTHILLLHRNENSNSFRSCAYLCSLCQYGCSSQTNMMEHMRIHTGEVLQCLAEDCCFRTPFDSVLREHVEFMHDDDFIVRCPHCGFLLNSRQTLANHFPLHHPRLCPLCVAVIRKHFPAKDEGKNTQDTAGADNSNRDNSLLLDLSSFESQVDIPIVTTVKRSRKQSKPRKIIQTDEDDEEENVDEDELKNSPKRKRKNSVSSSPTPSTSSNKSFSFSPLYRCRQCRPSLIFNQKKNWILHVRWNHVRKRFSCEHCPQTYVHQYQVLLHASRDHVVQRL